MVCSGIWAVCALEAQILISDAGDTYNDTSSPVSESFQANLNGCTEVLVSFNYSFSNSWEGPGNMEMPNECTFGTCNGDISNPTQGSCNDCWDFLYIELFVDGNPEWTELIGENGTTDAEQTGSYSFPVITCEASTITLDFLLSACN